MADLKKFDLQVGFARIDITPPLGVNVVGYFKERIADGILDNLYVNAVAVGKGNDRIMIMCVDSLYTKTPFAKKAIELIAKRTGLKEESIFINATHTHTGPSLDIFDNDRFAGGEDLSSLDIDKLNADISLAKIVDCAEFALQDMKPARMGFALTKAENIGFNRRYLMKDGSTQTNPGVNNPDIVKSIGLLDERLNVVRFEREDGSNIVIGNYGDHPDTIGGNKISGDWPALTRTVFEKAIDNTKCVFLNGAQGDINHIKINPVGGEYNGLENDFDNVPRGYAHAKHMANVVAGAMMQVYEKVEFVSADSVSFKVKTVNVPTNMPKKEDMKQAYYIKEMHEAGRDAELPYKGMLLTTFVAEALRMVRLENGPEFNPMNLSAVSIGNIVLIGIPGEPFTGIGMGLKEAEGWDMIMPCCLTNGSYGYFPMQDSYDEGGYEARSSNFKAGVAELLIKEGKELLDSMRKDK